MFDSPDRVDLCPRTADEVKHTTCYMCACRCGIRVHLKDGGIRFIDGNPTVKMLALAFLILIGVALIAEGFKLHIPKGYIYFAMAFSLAVEMLNIRLRKSSQKALKLHKEMTE